MNSTNDIDIYDIMSLSGDELQNIIIMAKERYVQECHKRKISYVKQRDIWRTYIGNPRREVSRKNKNDLISYLYDYYKEEEGKNYTFREAFEKFLIYREEELNRSPNTTIRDEQTYKRFIPDSFGNKKIISIIESDINKMVRKQVVTITPKEKALKEFITLVKQVFRFACWKKFIKEDPCKYLNINDYLKNCDMTKKDGDQKIFTNEEIETIKEILHKRTDSVKFDYNGYAVLLSIETGMRIAEIPPLRWEDITSKGLHIHRQQLFNKKTNEYFEVLYTKNERIHPKNGRYFPITSEIKKILDECKEWQEKLGIESEYIFCKDDGSPIKKRGIAKRVKKTCERLGYNISNNHAFRMTLNSNVLIPLGVPVTQRAYLLGHSVETNENYYSYMRSEELSNIKEKLENNGSYMHPDTQKIVNFTTNHHLTKYKKTVKSTIFA